ncbi:hypothetical protein HOY82DRAFT_644927 [Tuber indicum]|nr:hypothetical protein HOY82DRAFT_644927 [Tuber indicum]
MNIATQHSFSSTSSGVQAHDGATPLCNNRLFDSPNETVWNGYSLDGHPSSSATGRRHNFIPPYNYNLRGRRVPHCPHSGQYYGRPNLLTILAVLYYSDGVYTRDDSHPATTKLLKTVIIKFDDGKLMTGEELTASLDDASKVSVSYGTRKGRDGGPPEVDLTSDLGAQLSTTPTKITILEKQWSRDPRVAVIVLSALAEVWVRRFGRSFR